MKKQTGNKGITMIMLVVTVIILLIIASITVATLTGETGVLTNAGESKKMANSAEELEILNTSVAAAMGASNKAKVEETKLKYFFNQNIGDERKEETLEEDKEYDGYTLKEDENYEGYFYVTFLKTKNTYTITEDGEIITGKISDEEKIKMNKTILTMVKGETDKLYVETSTKLYEKTETITKNTIEWKSANESLVKITTNPANPKEVTVEAAAIGRTS